VQNQPTAASFFRQSEPPYFHAPTPPVGQAQEGYGGFGQLSQNAQLQGQNSHLGGFAGGDYGYDGQQRGFYENYAAQNLFNQRNGLGHDDVKGLPSQQPAGALNASTPQGGQSSQASSQPQSATGQGPQAYAPPVPYYHHYQPYPQNQYYPPYNNAYAVPHQAYGVKYPTMFQAGPPVQGSAPSPITKQPSLQTQSNPYGQGLYNQQSSYEEYPHQSAHAPNAGADYNKMQQQGLYGAQGIQGFMGLGQGAGASTGPPGQRAVAGGASPDAPYKSYAPGGVGGKDLGGNGVGVGQGGVGQGVQGRGAGGVAVQQPQHGQGGFYNTNRFGASGNAGAGPQQSQQAQGPQAQAAPQGYPQSGNENFYSYQQPRQQQGYWQ